MAEQVDFITGHYGFLSADHFVVLPGDYWSEFVLAHTKGYCHVEKTDNVILLNLTDASQQTVWLGGPRQFNLGHTFTENLEHEVKIYPTMEDAKTLKLRFQFKNACVRIVIYKFYQQQMIAEFRNVSSSNDLVCDFVTIVEFQRMVNFEV